MPDIAAKHGAVHDYNPDTSFCLRCHADSQVNRVAAHLPFRIDAQTAHRNTGCLQCHPLMRADKPYGADFGPAAFDCLACHHQAEMDDTHQAMPGYQYQSSSCIQGAAGACHADGTKPGD